MIIGLTGPMASGKNLASKILEKTGCVSVDADVLAHQAIEKAKDKILLTFEKEATEKNISVLNEDGSIKPHLIKGLEVGKTYYLEEIIAIAIGII